MAESKDIGALWIKQGKSGEFMSGSIEINGEKFPIVLFKNNYKKADNHPDWKIFPSKSKEEREAEAAGTTAQAPSEDVWAATPPATDEIRLEDIPF